MCFGDFRDFHSDIKFLDKPIFFRFFPWFSSMQGIQVRLHRKRLCHFEAEGLYFRIGLPEQKYFGGIGTSRQGACQMQGTCICTDNLDLVIIVVECGISGERAVICPCAVKYRAIPCKINLRCIGEGTAADVFYRCWQGDGCKIAAK